LLILIHVIEANELSRKPIEKIFKSRFFIELLQKIRKKGHRCIRLLRCDISRAHAPIELNFALRMYLK
jgi:hypothetical protein